MSVSFFDQISNFVAGTPNTTAAEPLHPNSVKLLVSLLHSKAVDLTDTLPLIDGSAVTYQQILDSRVENAPRPWISADNVGTIYELAHKLSKDEASKRIGELKKMANKPSSSGFKKNTSASPKNSSDTVSREEFSSFQELMISGFKAILEGQKPEASAGHSTVPAEPETVEEIAEEIALGDFKPGDVIRVNGVAVQISTDGKRLNKTIV